MAYSAPPFSLTLYIIKIALVKIIKSVQAKRKEEET
nr:MAG TPA: hypothetical protein [Caudoviricetes sp.]DAP43413.1 MAG TPA: hypothetical protein [Caudoviricetes sp.]